jgi:hypothetical protein
MPWRWPRLAAAGNWEVHMLKMIVVVTMAVLVISSSAIAGIVLAHVVLTRTSTVNVGSLADEAQSFRLVAKAPLTFDW